MRSSTEECVRRSPGLSRRILIFLSLAGTTSCATLPAQTVSIDSSAAGRKQTIDGFGTCISSDEGQEAWWQEMFLDDVGASILRVDLVPHFKSPWSNLSYYSPWFLGNGLEPYAFNFQITAARTPRYYVGSPGNPNATEFTNGYYNGPEGTRTRTYTNAADYSKDFGNMNAPVAVMGPNIDDNITRCLDLENSTAVTAAAVVAAAKERKSGLSRFKLVGSMWSPAPWLKVSSGNQTFGSDWPLQPAGVPYPHIWSGNFVGGRLDVSETPIAEFNDSGLPDDAEGPNADAVRGPTSALTQFARCTAAYLRGLQNRIGARFYAISIQNELNFETFYNSCTYPLSSQYIKAVEYVRAELDKYPDLRDIKIMGPEDLLSDSTYSLWQYGDGATTVHKNLQYLQSIGADPAAAAAVSFFCIHGYAADGVTSPGANPVGWDRWANGWSSSPAAGIPPQVKGFRQYEKKSWMTETSGESTAWGTVSDNGAFTIAAKIHQALTTGRESAWVYWQMTDGGANGDQTLTDASLRTDAPKLTAFRHYCRYIRPGAVRLAATVSGTESDVLLASAFLHDEDRTLTIVLTNTASAAVNATIELPDQPEGIAEFSTVTSSADALWQPDMVSVNAGSVVVSVPASGVATLYGQGTPVAHASRIVDLSARGHVGTGEDVLIAGFVLEGAPAKGILVRGIGPSLAAFGVSDPLEDPQLQLMSGSDLLLSNDNWAGDAAVETVSNAVGAFALDPSSMDAVIISDPLTGGAAGYTAVIGGGGNSTGVALAELYDTASATGARLVNISARCAVGSGDNVLIGGFVIAGNGPRLTLIRGIGPALADFGISGALADARLTLVRTDGGASTTVAQNDDWGGGAVLADAMSTAGAFPLPADSKDAAMLDWLDPGAYTAQVSGVGSASGVALVEIYELE